MAALRVVDGRYELVRLLGEGGMGAVYEARHTGTGRRVAIKLILGEEVSRNPELVARFQREARASGAIESQHIAHVLDTGRDAATRHPYLVMEYLDGSDLQHAIEGLGPLDPQLALRIIAQVCIGLDKAHQAGIIHRDIKPANLFLARQDAGGVLVKLLDFGIAKVKMEKLSSSEGVALTRTGAMLGSPLYMSPEQARGSKAIDHRTDLWSLGVVLYEALSGTTPYAHAESLGALILAICSEPPRPIQEHAPWVPPEVAAIVHKALSHAPDQRFASALEMLDACQTLLPKSPLAFALSEDMLRPLDAAQRAHVAPRLATSAAASSSSGAGVGPVSVRAVTAGGPPIHTDAAVAKTTAGPPRTKRSRGVVPIALGAVVALGASAVYVQHRMATREAPPQAAQAAAKATNDAPPPTASAAPTGTPAEAATSAKVAVSPSGVTVEVDGRPAPVVDGGVEIHGTLGSRHDVILSLGKRRTTAQVVLSDEGPIPPQLELPVPSEPRAAVNPGARGATPPSTAAAAQGTAPKGATPSAVVDTTFR